MTPITQINGPIEAESRIELIDALRGFALAGVLFVNLRLFTQFDFLTDDQYASLASASYDEVLNLLAQLFGDGKFITIFSMLFGYGFSLQISRLEARGEPAVRLYIRRALALLAIGFVHSLLWWGDILRTYAVLAFVLLLTRRWPAKRLAWTGAILAVAFAIVPTTISMGPESAAYQEAYLGFSGRSFLETLRANRALDWFEFLRYPWAFPFVLSRFLIGSAAGKAGVLADPAAHRSLLRRVSIAGAIIGMAAVIGFLFLHDGWFEQDAPGWDLLLGLNTIGFAVAYACWFSLLYMKRIPHLALRHLAPVGRMCLTNYLMQTIVCVMVFYGFGLGIGPRFGMPGVFATWAIIFGSQMILSPMWLSRFRFGPAEWLWRSLTYGRIP